MVKCIKCGKDVCHCRAQFYKEPYNQMCTECRDKEMEQKRLNELISKVVNCCDE